jgi:glycosyltransferase involved in cell wall biosynthesis
MTIHSCLRVAFVAGTLGQGGAEKQLLYMVQCLCQAGVEVVVYTLTQGEYYESKFHELQVPTVWIGLSPNPLIRLFTLIHQLLKFQPQMIQSAHPFANLYAGLAGKVLNITSIGAMRSSWQHSKAENGVWSRLILSLPTAIIVNSQAARDELVESKLIKAQKLFFLPNVIDLSSFTNPCSAASLSSNCNQNITVILIGRLISVKRVDYFLQALVKAKAQVPALKGTIVGDGPERLALQQLATELELPLSAVTFLGARQDVATLLAEADLLVLSSDSEGFPNVLLEAMAAELPVITTKVGDADKVVQHEHTGYTIPPGDVVGLTAKMIELAQSATLRQQMGKAGRKRVEKLYSLEQLNKHLLTIYEQIAVQNGDKRLRYALS